MPTRLLREGILDSERVNLLSVESELFYRRLFSVVDDYGRFEASARKLRPKVFPLRLDLYSEANVQQMLDECSAGDRPLLLIYEADGKQYLQVTDFNQKARSKSKFPGPPITTALQVPSECKAVAEHPITNAHLDGDVFGDGDVFEGAGGRGRRRPSASAGVAPRPAEKPMQAAKQPAASGFATLDEAVTPELKRLLEVAQ